MTDKAKKFGRRVVIGQEGFVDGVFLKSVTEEGDRIVFDAEAVVMDFVRQPTARGGSLGIMPCQGNCMASPG